jgi:glycerol uptake facilitator-like aquaporin
MPVLRARMTVTLMRKAASEAAGTAFLLATVIGSGIMGERLSGGNVAIALLANTIATGAALVALILTFGPISGDHFNPAVTLVDASQGGVPWRDVPAYIAAQVVGAFLGVASAHLMFSESLFSVSNHTRSGISLNRAIDASGASRRGNRRFQSGSSRHRIKAKYESQVDAHSGPDAILAAAPLALRLGFQVR